MNLHFNAVWRRNMRKLFVVMAVLLLSAAVAWADMKGVSELELGQIQGQTGLTVQIIGLSVSIARIGWGDDDGFGAVYTEPGWVVRDVDASLMNINFGGYFDVGTDPVGGDSALLWTTMGIPIVTGDLAFNAVRIQGDYAVDGPSLGEFVVPGVTVSFADPLLNPFGIIAVSAH
jgi:hypothetical protein